MFEFPLIEADNKIELVDLINTESWRSLFVDIKIEVKDHLVTKVHKLSHQNLHIEFIEVKVDNDTINSLSSFVCVDSELSKDYPLPKPIELYLARS